MPPKYELLSGALPRALPAGAGRDRRSATMGSEELASTPHGYPCKRARSISCRTNRNG